MDIDFSNFTLTQEEYSHLYGEFMTAENPTGGGLIADSIKDMTPEDVAGLALLFGAECYKVALTNVQEHFGELLKESAHAKLLVENAQLRLEIKKLKHD